MARGRKLGPKGREFVWGAGFVPTPYARGRLVAEYRRGAGTVKMSIAQMLFGLTMEGGRPRCTVVPISISAFAT
jgi:hypothetical protein